MTFEQKWRSLLSRLEQDPVLRYHFPDPELVGEELEEDCQNKRAEEGALREAFLDKAFGQTNPKKGAALDAGCGRGWYTEQLQQEYSWVLSLDADALRLATAAALGHDDARHRFVAAPLTAESLLHPDAKGMFLLIQCLQVLGHVPLDHVRRILDAFSELLHPEGALLLALPFHQEPWDLFCLVSREAGGGEVIQRVQHRQYEMAVKQNRPGILPVRYFCQQSLELLMSDAGFEVVESEPYHRYSESTRDLFVLARKRPS